MTDTGKPFDARRLGEAIRQACLESALAGYEHAALSGLCHEGAWEAAVSAIQGADLSTLVGAEAVGVPAPEAGPSGTPGELTASLARQFASPGPPAAGSAAAATGAIAAGILEWSATLSEQRGPDSFRKRARAIARRAAVLQSTLAAAGQEDAESVKALLRAQRRGSASESLQRATDSVLKIGSRCSQVVALAAEVVVHGQRVMRPDVQAALRLASSAGECALDLAEENLGSDAEQEWARRAKRRAWRTRLRLQRASTLVGDDGPR